MKLQVSESDGDLAALGYACLGLGHAIKGLSTLGLTAEAKELAKNLKYLSGSLSWSFRQSHKEHVNGS
jgi:hypothetical protein